MLPKHKSDWLFLYICIVWSLVCDLIQVHITFRHLVITIFTIYFGRSLIVFNFIKFVSSTQLVQYMVMVILWDHLSCITALLNFFRVTIIIIFFSCVWLEVLFFEVILIIIEIDYNFFFLFQYLSSAFQNEWHYIAVISCRSYLYVYTWFAFKNK